MMEAVRHRFVLAAWLAVLLSADSRANATCPTTEPPNVVLLIADDLGWSDLPFFSKPVRWPDDEPVDNYHYQLWNPPLNRFAARTKAAVGEPLHTIDSGSTPLNYAVPAPQEACGEPTFTPQCSAESDVLEGHGGLAELARGAVFSRFYAASAVCSPSRASIFTGRHASQHQSKDVHDPIAPHEVTIAEYLKQGCQDGMQCWGTNGEPKKCECYGDQVAGSCLKGAESAPCYTTGLIGKWHIGFKASGEAPWQQGFDEFVGFRGGSRGYFSQDDLTCSPVMKHVCDNDPQQACDPGAVNPCGVGNDCIAIADANAGLYTGPREDAKSCTLTADGKNYVETTDDYDCCTRSGGGPHRASRYKVPGRSVDRIAHCNDNATRARDVLSGTCAGGTAAGQPCFEDDHCPGGTCSGVSAKCHGGANDQQPCESHLDCPKGRCDAGCIFSERTFRDLAVDFIKRHGKPIGNVGRKPFFLTLSFHAVHSKWQGTERSKRHYTTAGSTPKQPSDPVDFWAIVEETDAAVGQVLKALDDEGIRNETLILYTHDQGRPRGHYGESVLRGGKFQVFDGGTRVGLLGQACGEEINPGDFADHVGGHVDLFPTITDAAGFSTDLFKAGPSDPPQLKACHKSAQACPDGECPLPDGPCRTHNLPGSSFYDVLNRAGTTPAPASARDFVFSKYLDGSTVVTRPGRYDGVCGRVETRVGRPTDDVVRAGSCIRCDDVDDCADQFCRTVGKVCVNSAKHPDGPAGRCEPDYTKPCVNDRDCADDDFPNEDFFCKYEIADIGDRCGDGCGANRACEQVSVLCDECVDAVWKLKRRGLSHVGLWDLATNPEEDAEIDCTDDPAADAVETCLEEKLCAEEGFPCPPQAPVCTLQ